MLIRERGVRYQMLRCHCPFAERSECKPTSSRLLTIEMLMVLEQGGMTANAMSTGLLDLRGLYGCTTVVARVDWN